MSFKMFGPIFAIIHVSCERLKMLNFWQPTLGIRGKNIRCVDWKKFPFEDISFFIFWPTNKLDKWRLEIRSNGFRSFISLDIFHCCTDGHFGHRHLCIYHQIKWWWDSIHMFKPVFFFKNVLLCQQRQCVKVNENILMLASSHNPSQCHHMLLIPHSQTQTYSTLRKLLCDNITTDPHSVSKKEEENCRCNCKIIRRMTTTRCVRFVWIPVNALACLHPHPTEWIHSSKAPVQGKQRCAHWEEKVVVCVDCFLLFSFWN